MKKFIGYIVIMTIVALITFSMVSCSDNSSLLHTHIPGAAATCIAPQTCTDCGAVIQAAFGHDFSGTWATTDIVIKTCQRSGCAGTHSLDDEMASIPQGTFTMGPDIWNNNATFSVTLSAFKMGKYTITQELYQAVMGTNPSSFSSSPNGTEVQGKRPVETVNWYHAIAFCNKLSIRDGLTPVYSVTGINFETLSHVAIPTSSNTTWDAATATWTNNGYRLPTDAQWEYACRADTSTDWHFGNTESQLINYAWFSDNSDSKTHQVGKKLPNPWGLYDMHGNVWEWCWDWYDKFPAGSENNYTGAASGTYRVIRGGGWYGPAGITCSFGRSYDDPDSGGNALGFRLVRP